MLPNGKQGTCEQEYENFQRYLEMIRQNSEVPQKCVLVGFQEGDNEMKSFYHPINLNAHRKEVVYVDITQKGVPTFKCNKKQLTVEKLVNVIPAIQKPK